MTFFIWIVIIKFVTTLSVELWLLLLAWCSINQFFMFLFSGTLTRWLYVCNWMGLSLCSFSANFAAKLYWKVHKSTHICHDWICLLCHTCPFSIRNPLQHFCDLRCIKLLFGNIDQTHFWCFECRLKKWRLPVKHFAIIKLFANCMDFCAMCFC